MVQDDAAVGTMGADVRRSGVLMSAIPASFRAYVATKGTDSFERGVRDFAEADLPPGEVEIRVAWSSVNYKDGLAVRADGKVARISPLIPGIDLAGEVIASADPTIDVGAAVLVHGYELGVSRHGGYAEYQRVPADWVVPLERGFSATRRDGDRHCWVHRGDVRGGAGGSRPGARVRSGARHRSVGWCRWDGGRDPGRAWLRGVGIDRKAGRG